MVKKFKTIKKVISGGCSFTAGSELADFDYTCPLNGILHPRSKSTWDNIISRNLFVNATLDQTALPGLDFGAIVRRVIFQLRENLKTHNPEEIVVLIMWTSALRREYVSIYPNEVKIKNNEDRFLCSLPCDEGTGFTLMTTSQLQERLKRWKQEYLRGTLREFYRLRTSPDNIMYYPLQQLEYLKNYLENNNIKYFFTTAFNDIVEIYHKENIFLQDMFERLDLKNLNFMVENEGFYRWAKNNNYACGKEADHPLEQAHQDWADLFANWILTKSNF